MFNSGQLKRENQQVAGKICRERMCSLLVSNILVACLPLMLVISARNKPLRGLQLRTDLPAEFELWPRCSSSNHLPEE